jgi:hypothetical protein
MKSLRTDCLRRFDFPLKILLDSVRGISIFILRDFHPMGKSAHTAGTQGILPGIHAADVSLSIVINLLLLISLPSVLGLFINS